MKVINKHKDKHFPKDVPFEDIAMVKIMVEDADEPPVFISDKYMMEIDEGAMNGSSIGAVTARDPDQANSPIRYV